MARDRVRDPAGAFVVRKLDLPAAARLLPGAHQHVLQHGKLVGIVADLVQQALRHGRADRRAAFLRRLLDRGAPLGAAQVRHQELTLAQRLGQALKARAVAEEIEPHGQHDVDARARGAHCGEQQAHERGRLVGVAAAHAFEAEDLLELIDDDQQPGRRSEVQFARRFGEAEAGAAEHRVHAARPQRLRFGVLGCTAPASRPSAAAARRRARAAAGPAAGTSRCASSARLRRRFPAAAAARGRRAPAMTCRIRSARPPRSAGQAFNFSRSARVCASRPKKNSSSPRSNGRKPG